MFWCCSRVSVVVLVEERYKAREWLGDFVKVEGTTPQPQPISPMLILPI
jgi:hypothetical protein